MIVSDILRKLSLSELSNLSLANGGDGTIVENKVPTMIEHVNDALLRLYSKFCMKQKDLILETVANLSLYELSAKFAWTQRNNNDELYHYIIDHAEPFTGDVIKVLEVFSPTGKEIPLNDKNHHFSVFTPSPNIIQIPNPDNWGTLGVGYQASHPLITAVTDEVSLPLVLEEPLRAYIAYKIFSGMGGQENGAKAAEHLGIFESLCNEVVEKDLVNTSISTTDEKFHNRGFA